MKSLIRLLPYLARYKKTLLYGALAVIGANLFTVAQPKFIGLAIDELKEGIETHRFVGVDLLMWAILIVAFSLFAGFLTFLMRQTIIVVSRHIEFDLRNDLLSHLQKLHYSYFQNTSTGDLMAHATNDIASVRNVLGPGIMYPADTIMTFSMVLTMMIILDWQLTLISLLPMPFISYIVYRMGKMINKRFTERQEQYSILTARAQENLSGVRVIKAYVREEFEIAYFARLSWDYLKKNMVLAQWQALLWPLMFLLVSFMFMLAIYFGGARVIDGTLTIGSLTAFFSYLLMMIWPMIAFGWVTNILQQGSASMKRITTILDTEPLIRDTKETDFSICEIKGDVEFRNVSLTHTDSKIHTIRNLNFSIPRGITAAFVGHVGSGKSTIVNLIERLYESTEGDVLIDGVNIKKIPLDVLRSNVGIVPQETFLFSDTIAENIKYGTSNGTPEQIQHASEIAQLIKDINEFPQRFDTIIGERGITLSGGQKQRAGIARAIIREPKILILDDALSAVDTYTEDEILIRLRDFMNGRTSIIISHRISTVKNADVIFVLDKGEIVERGTHDELIAVGGIYADLYERQLLEEELEKL
jgi:ATP-binding cassette subfamily B protein